MEQKKISFFVEKEVGDRLNNVMPWGQMARVYRKMTLDLLEYLETQNPDAVVGAILSGHLRIGSPKEVNKTK